MYILEAHACVQARDHGNFMNKSSTSSYFGVPKPVIGSHPLTALNPELPQLGFEPFVMSVKTEGF